MKIFFVYCFIVVATTIASKCPEPKKPHPTSCTIFYNCVNLPTSGYVWVPSKCTDGLVFQPYLRICVLPGDTWTCDNLSTESSLITNKYATPELIDPSETSYMGSTEDALEFSEFIDSSYTTDEITDAVSYDTVTPYPLIETEGTVEKERGEYASNVPASGTEKEKNPKDQFALLNQLINHLLVYKEITIPLEFLASSSFPVSMKNGVNSNSYGSFKLTDSSKNKRQNVLLNYLTQNYIQQNNLQNTVITDTEMQNRSDTSKMVTENIMNDPQSNMENIDPIISDQEAENNIVLINDGMRNKQYFTVEKYKSLAHQMNSRFVSLIPCTKNVRLPNKTDCTRYYTCIPQTALVTEYSCPLNTAFNKYTRVCDTESRNVCTENKYQIDKSESKNSEHFEDTVKTKRVCEELGKMKDPTSDSHYYICYAPSGTSSSIKSMRMTCPNNLIFCQSKKVCTTRHLCKTIQTR